MRDVLNLYLISLANYGSQNNRDEVMTIHLINWLNHTTPLDLYTRMYIAIYPIHF